MAARVSGPPALPLLGHSPAFLRDKLGFLSRCAREYGDVVELRLGGTTFLLVQPADIRHVLVTNAANYHKSPRVTGPSARAQLGQNVLTSEGAEHQRLRRALRPQFHPGVLDRFAPVIVEHAEGAAARWVAEGTIDAADEMRRLALRCALAVLLGERIVQHFPEIFSAVETRRRYIDALFTSALPLPHLWPTRVNLQYRTAARQLRRVVDAAIDTAEAPSLVSALVRDSHGLSRAEIREQVVALSVSAYETVAASLAWTIFLLAQHPGEEAKLAAEVGEVLHHRPLSAAEVPRLPQVQRVWAEALRLFPPTWLFVRVARAADVLPSGAAVPAGCKIYLSQYVTHRDPRFFPDPERFVPERFAEDAIRSRPALAYFPFGGGPRLCLGETLARLEAALVLATVVRRLRLELAPGQHIGPVPGVTLEPSGPIRVAVHRR